MLDAAHGQRVGPVVRVQGVHVGCSEPDVARVRMVGRKGRRRPPPTAVADGRQGSRRVVAVARSRRCEAIAGMNAAESRNNGFCCECRCVHLVRNVGRSLRGTLAGLRCARLRPARLEEPNDGDDKIVRSGRLWGGALARAGPGRKVADLEITHYALFANSAADWDEKLPDKTPVPLVGKADGPAADC